MKKLSLIALSIAGLVAMTSTHANPEKYIIGSGGGGQNPGAYFTMTNDFIRTCSAQAGGLDNMEQTGGSPANLVGAATKKIDIFWTQSDVYALAVRENPATYGAMKAIAGLHNEEVHVFALPDLKVGKTMGIGGKTPTTFAQLGTDELKIGAWGGSLKTADALVKHIMPKRVPGWKPIVGAMSAPTDKADLIAQMKAAGVSVVVRVSGKPDTIFEKMAPGSLIPLSVDPEIAKSNPDFFVPSILDTYTNLSPNSTQTIAVQALLMARYFDDPEDITRISALRDCLVSNLSNFRNRRGFHPKWADVNTLDPRVTVTMFPFVKVTPAPVPATPAKPAKKPWPGPASVSSKNNSFSSKMRLNSPCTLRVACVAKSATTKPGCTMHPGYFLSTFFYSLSTTKLSQSSWDQ